MTTPMKPVASAALLAAAARLNFRAMSRDRSGSTLGVLIDASGSPQHLVITSGGDEGTWAFSSVPPKKGEAILLYESAANVLRGGAANEDGSISYQGDSYVIESSFDGDAKIAKVRGSA